MGNDTIVTAVPRRKTRVGYNYPWPWDKYGIYFGGGSPPGSDPLMEKWIDTLRTNLTLLRDDMGITLVRVFLFCNLANVGSVAISGSTRWSFDWSYALPAALDAKFVEHLQKMLGVFRDLKMQVIPSLIDFLAVLKAFDLGKTGCTARYEILTNPAKREQFLDLTLDPFLAASKPFKDQILAWEVINEPSWSTASWFIPTQTALPKSVVKSFLSHAVRRIDNFRGDDGKALFKSTVGHRYASDMNLYDTGTLPQFHYYPTTALDIGGDGDLPKCADVKNAILGEFGAGGPADWKHTEWPEIPSFAQRAGGDIRVLLRLQLIEAKGYDVALLWPDMNGAPAGPTDPLKLSAACQKGVRTYQST